MLAPGDLFRIGGIGSASAGSAASSSATNAGVSVDGSVLFGLGMAEASPGSPLLRPLVAAANSSSSTKPATPVAVVYPGEQLRLGATSYTVKKTGVAVQVISLDCAYDPNTGNGGPQGPCGTFQVHHLITTSPQPHSSSLPSPCTPYTPTIGPVYPQWHDRHLHHLLW